MPFIVAVSLNLLITTTSGPWTWWPIKAWLLRFPMQNDIASVNVLMHVAKCCKCGPTWGDIECPAFFDTNLHRRRTVLKVYVRVRRRFNQPATIATLNCDLLRQAYEHRTILRVSYDHAGNHKLRTQARLLDRRRQDGSPVPPHPGSAGLSSDETRRNFSTDVQAL